MANFGLQPWQNAVHGPTCQLHVYMEKNLSPFQIRHRNRQTQTPSLVVGEAGACRTPSLVPTLSLQSQMPSSPKRRGSSGAKRPLAARAAPGTTNPPPKPLPGQRLIKEPAPSQSNEERTDSRGSGHTRMWEFAPWVPVSAPEHMDASRSAPAPTATMSAQPAAGMCRDPFQPHRWAQLCLWRPKYARKRGPIGTGRVPQGPSPLPVPLLPVQGPAVPSAFSCCHPAAVSHNCTRVRHRTWSWPGWDHGSTQGWPCTPTKWAPISTRPQAPWPQSGSRSGPLPGGAGGQGALSPSPSPR